MKMKLIATVLFALLLAACQPAQTQPTENVEPPMQEKSEPVVENPVQAEEEPVDCTYEERIVGDSFQYRAPCNNGYFLVFSFANFQGGPDDTGQMNFYVALIKATSEWTTGMSNVTRIALYGDNSQDLAVMHGVICSSLKGDPSNDIPARIPYEYSELPTYLKANPCP